MPQGHPLTPAFVFIMVSSKTNNLAPTFLVQGPLFGNRSDKAAQSLRFASAILAASNTCLVSTV